MGKINIFKEERKQLQEHYGKDYYIDLMCEESAELSQALFKARRYGENDMRLGHIKEEIVDTMICVQHLIDLYGISANDIYEMMQYKYNRAVDRMNEVIK